MTLVLSGYFWRFGGSLNVKVKSNKNDGANTPKSRNKKFNINDMRKISTHLNNRNTDQNRILMLNNYFLSEFIY